MSDELEEHLSSLARDECYRVDAVLKRSSFETTQRVYFVGANGSEQGPYVRKFLEGEGLGGAYERIWRAQRAGRRFLHLPRIVECYSAGERRVVVMEHVKGETLAEAVYRRDPSVALAGEVFPSLCDAARELHEGFDPPLIHRDLKPSNVMLAPGGLALIDFGIARSFDEGAEADTRRFGTRAYAPPEQFGFGQTDERSDVYALGLLLYFCLTEQTPDTAARARGYAHELVPEPLRAVVARAAAFDPAARYGSAAELKAAFDAAMGAGCARGASAAEARRVSSGAVAGAAAFRGGLSELPAPDPDSRVVPARADARSPEGSGGGSAALGEPTSLPLPDFAAKGKDRKGRKGLWGRVPASAGMVWNGMVLAVAAGLFAVSTGVTLFPSPESDVAAMSLAGRAVCYYAMFAFMFCPVLYLVSDRRPIKRRFPALSRLSFGWELVFFAACEVAGIVVIGIAFSLFPAG